VAKELVTGRIVWAQIADPNGIRKTRPAIIVSPAEKIIASQPFDVVAVTSRMDFPLPEDYVLLPWHRQGHGRTGLNRKCAAVCSWLTQIVDSDISEVAGIVPSPIMAEILVKVAAAIARSDMPDTNPK
jgi:mRNA-degrading endonuclease toxin of MazEF toxin-antitoxin module